MSNLAAGLSIGLSAVALGLAGYATLSASRASGDGEKIDRLEAQIDELRVLGTRIENLESRVGTGMAPPRPLEPVPLAAAPRPAGVTAVPGAADAKPLDPKTATEMAAAFGKRIEDLEEKMKAQESSGHSFRMGTAGAPGGAFFGTKKFYGSMDDAQADLELSPSQRADLDRIVADAKRDMEDLHRLPDEDGKTWEQTNQEAMKGIMDGSGKLDFSKLMAFRGKTIPGRSETYGQAEARIKTNARKQMRDGLTPDQQTKFDQAMVDPLLGGGMGQMIAISAFSTTDDAGMAPK
jgi:hypothetical protein